MNKKQLECFKDIIYDASDALNCLADKINNVEAAESDFEKVMEFTKESGAMVSLLPTPLTKEQVRFLVGMCASELVEMAQTVCDTPEEAMSMVSEGVKVDLNRDYKRPTDKFDVIAEQADAAVDCWYYMLNAFCKTNTNLSRVFDVVHAANMAKKFPDGTFHKRDDGKILKPEGWTPPDIVNEIQFQHYKASV